MHTPPANSALKRRAPSLGGRLTTPDGSPIAGAAAVARAAGFGMDGADSPIRKRRPSRVSFADSVDVQERESSPDKDPASGTEDLPPSPTRSRLSAGGQRSNRSTYSFGIRLSVGGEERDVQAVASLPSSPPESPGRYKQAWTCLKQRWEDMEMKQRDLEEADFELQEEKKEHKENRAQLARKMSEMEALELRRSAKEKERLSATPVSSPPSSRKTTPSRGSPSPMQELEADEPEELVHAAVQTEEVTPAPEEAPPRQRSRCRGFLCHVLLKVVSLACIVVLPRLAQELPAETLAKMAAWVPSSLEGIVSFEKTGSALQCPSSSPTQIVADVTPGRAVGGSCEDALQQTRLALASARDSLATHRDQVQPVAQAGIAAAQGQTPSVAQVEPVEEHARDPYTSQSAGTVEIQSPAPNSWWPSSLLATSVTVALVAIRYTF